MRDAGRRYTAPTDLRARVRRQIAVPARSRFLSLVPYFATAAVILAAVLVVTIGRGDRHSALELADLHVATLASSNPVDVVSTDRHTVKPWFQGRIPFTFDLPILDGSPFRLVGGKMVYLRQSAGAQLVYQYQQHRVSVFIFREVPELKLERVVTVQNNASFSFDTWPQNGLRYAVIGDVSPDVIQQLVALFKAASQTERQ